MVWLQKEMLSSSGPIREDCWGKKEMRPWPQTTPEAYVGLLLLPFQGSPLEL